MEVGIFVKKEAARSIDLQDEEVRLGGLREWRKLGHAPFRGKMGENTQGSLAHDRV